LNLVILEMLYHFCCCCWINESTYVKSYMHGLCRDKVKVTRFNGLIFFYLLFKFYAFVKTENNRDRRGHDHMVFWFTTTCAIWISAYNHWCCEFESCSWRGVFDTNYVITAQAMHIWFPDEIDRFKVISQCLLLW
jgi:hypothetical protein